MEWTAVLNQKDTDQVEIWSSDSQREYLSGIMHIDAFTGPVNDRIQDGHPVKLHIEISQPKAYEILSALSEEGFDGLSRERQDDAMDDIRRCLSDLAFSGWDYDVMAYDNMARGAS